MTTSLVWTGVALWLVLNTAFALRLYAVQAGRAIVTPDRKLRRV